MFSAACCDEHRQCGGPEREYAVGSQASNTPVTRCQSISPTIAVSGEQGFGDALVGRYDETVPGRRRADVVRRRHLPLAKVYIPAGGNIKHIGFPGCWSGADAYEEFTIHTD